MRRYLTLVVAPAVMAMSFTWSAHGQSPPPTKPTAESSPKTPVAPPADNVATRYESAWFASEGGAAPPGYHWETSTVLPLAVSGGITLAASHGLTSLAVLFIPSCRGDDCRLIWDHGGAWVFAPVVGPFIAMATTDPTPNLLGLITLGAFGSTQAAGLGMLIAGVTMRENELVQDKPEVRVAPLLGAGMAGVTMTGTF